MLSSCAPLASNASRRLVSFERACFGAHFTVADAYLFTVLSWTDHVGIEIDRWPQLKNYRDRIGSRPAVREALLAEGLLR